MTNLKNECGKDKPEITKNKLKTDILTVPVSMQLDEVKGQKERKIRYWIKSLGLSLQNKQEIDNNKWLSDNHIRTAHYLLKQQFANFWGDGGYY